jgi:2'-5' RNA ligase
MQDEPIRIFFAIRLNDILIKNITRYLNHLRKTLTFPIRWARESQLHLTLRFLGSIQVNQLEEIYKVNHIFKDFHPFDITLKEITAFPAFKPRIIGIKIEPVPELLALTSSLEEYFREIGFEAEERTFLPHITLGRIAKPRKRTFNLKYDYLPQNQRVEQITLFKSQLTPEGSIYTILKEFNLAAEELSQKVIV